VVEDVRAKSRRGQKRWNSSFSPLEVGKNWFYIEVQQLVPLTTKRGWETQALREQFGLKKTSKKGAEVFSAHCVDSWVLAADVLTLNRPPLMTRLLCVAPLNFRRRSLHLQTPKKGGERRVHGGTLTAGHRKGSLVNSPKLGLTYLGGSSKVWVSLHCRRTGRRLSQKVLLSACKVLGYSSMRSYWSS
jgi:hypothetical protein